MTELTCQGISLKIGKSFLITDNNSEDIHWDGLDHGGCLHYKAKTQIIVQSFWSYMKDSE